MNAFELLDLGLSLLLADDEIEDAYRRKAAAEHPDAGGDAAEFGKLREAKEILLSPSRRLAEWMKASDLEMDPRGEIEAGLVDLFQEVAVIGASAEEAVRTASSAQSALAKAMAEVKLMKAREKVKATQQRIGDEIHTRLPLFEKIQIAPDVTEAAKLVRDLRFLEKWQSGLRGLYGRLM